MGEYPAGPCNLVYGPVSSFDEDVGREFFDEYGRRIFTKQDDCINRGQGSHNEGPAPLRIDGSCRPFQPFHTLIGIEPNDEPVAKGAGFGEVAHVSFVEDVEAPVCKDATQSLKPPAGYNVQQGILGMNFAFGRPVHRIRIFVQAPQESRRSERSITDWQCQRRPDKGTVPR